jgi:hypothetical protein
MDGHVDHVTPTFVDVEVMEKVGTFIVQGLRQVQQHAIFQVGSHRHRSYDCPGRSPGPKVPSIHTALHPGVPVSTLYTARQGGLT